MGRNDEMIQGWLNARNHNQLPNIVSTHPDNPTLRYHMREHSAPTEVEEYLQQASPKERGILAIGHSLMGGFQRQKPLEGEPKKKFRAKTPPKNLKGAFPEPGMASAPKPCKNYEPADMVIGHEHACANCGWNHR
jgi:hypothetical protein